MSRKTCEGCGQENVTHDVQGRPSGNHTRGMRHRTAEARILARKLLAEVPDRDEGCRQYDARMGVKFAYVWNEELDIVVAREAHAEHVRRHPDAGAPEPDPDPTGVEARRLLADEVVVPAIAYEAALALLRDLLDVELEASPDDCRLCGMEENPAHGRPPQGPLAVSPYKHTDECPIGRAQLVLDALDFRREQPQAAAVVRLDLAAQEARAG